MIAGRRINNSTKYKTACKTCQAPLLMGQVQQADWRLRWCAFDQKPVPKDNQLFFRYHVCPKFMQPAGVSPDD